MPTLNFAPKIALLLVCLLASPLINAQGLKRLYHNPDIELSDYNKVLLNDINISDARIIPPSWAEGAARNPHSWDISKKNVAAFQQAFQDDITAKLEGEGGYPVVTEPGDATLEISIEIISLTPYAKRDEKVITKGSGELVMQVTLRDALTGKLLAIMEGGQQVGHHYQENSDLSKKKDINEMFAEWGTHIRSALDNAHGK